MEGEKEDMCVLVTTEDTTPLLGMDHPHFDDILWKEKRAKWEHDSSPPPQQTLLEDTDINKEDYGGSSPVDEEHGGLEEEEVLGGGVFAVQTKKGNANSNSRMTKLQQPQELSHWILLHLMTAYLDQQRREGGSLEARSVLRHVTGAQMQKSLVICDSLS